MLAVGTTVAGYRIDGVLGRGGMGVVYEATQLSLDRTVALKLIVPELGQEKSNQERFRREGLRQAAIDHPHIVTVHEAGEAPEGLFFAMRLVRGPTLKDMIIARELDAGRALRIMAAIADALDTAHEAGMTHRDLKPQNILVGGRDHAFLADFGLTKALGDHTLTRSGQFVGTLDYVAPEQIRGETAASSSDIYSFAAVLYECLTGIVPYPKESEAAVLYGHLSLPAPKVSEQRPDLPPTLDGVIARGMAKEPRDRFPTAVALMQEASETFSRRIRAAMTPPGPLESPEEVGIRAGEANVSTDESPVRRPEAEPDLKTTATGRLARRSDPKAGTPVLPEAAGEGREESSARRRVALAVSIVGTAVILGAAGYLAGSSGGGRETGGRTVAAGSLRMEIPSTWRRTPAVPDVPGLELQGAASFAPGGSSAGATLIAGTSDGRGPTLLPAAFLARLSRPPTTDDAVVLGDLEAYRYRDLRPRGLRGRLTMFVVPTENAVATVACLGPSGGGSVGACEQAAGTLTLEGARAIGVGARAAYAKPVDEALTRLGGRRTSDRKELREADEPARQASVARELARAYDDARLALSRAPAGPAEQPTHSDLLRDTRKTAAAYRGMASAAGAADREAYGRAAEAVTRGERAIARDLRSLRRVGYRIS